MRLGVRERSGRGLRLSAFLERGRPREEEREGEGEGERDGIMGMLNVILEYACQRK